jgi:hypothetical protein
MLHNIFGKNTRAVLTLCRSFSIAAEIARGDLGNEPQVVCEITDTRRALISGKEPASHYEHSSKTKICTF